MRDQIELVACDVDGTLLFGYGAEVERDALEQIGRLPAHGVRFVVASGRQYACARRLFAEVADDAAFICENGSLVVWRGEVLVRHAMERELALGLCHDIMGRGLDLLVSGERTCYVLDSASGFAEHMRRVVGNDTTEVAAPECIDEPIIKVSYMAPPEVLAAESAGFRARYGRELDVVTSGAIWMDIMPKGHDKAAALAELGALWGIDPAHMAAFGDEENDRTMLDLVGHPYLMASGNKAMRTMNGRIRVVDSVAAELARLMEG